MLLTDLITVIPPDREEEPEDIFACAPGLLFPDDTTIMYGDAESTLVYKSSRFGNIELRTAEPASERERTLFAHYLWNAGLKMAEMISQEDDGCWGVRGHRVLELGAGAGLDGIVACHAGASEVVISDYPSSALLDNIRRNAKKAVPIDLQSRYSVEGYVWGDTTSPFAVEHAHSFSRIIAADCYWMAHENVNLIKSMLHFLQSSPDARILAIAGFHTGRAILTGFFDEAIAQGLCIEEIYEENTRGGRREWARERDGGLEHVIDRKRWLVLAVLKRGDQ